ncbi:hypothetical protein I7I51_06464 [Histoplasma capsulatum]|uniref:Uncharacterized protein n=1 Tax=Ajellomyces capsulatus TaxID=5037 RepID=A0A8A1MG80_AJECA|nr:hypothetical protein I7I51_06464 [Histoplasma capsulatum]
MFSNQSTRQLPASSPYSDQVEEQNIVDTVERTHEDEVDDQRADQCLNHQRWTPRKTKGTKQTPKGLPDHWRYTPSIMDPKSYAFTSLANEASTYYTATPTGMGMLCHTQVPDLSTPGMNLNLLSPLSTPPASMQSAIDMNSCHHSFAPQAGNGVDAFIHPLAYGPSCFINPGLSYDPLHVENSPINGVNANKLIGLLPHGISLSTPGDNRTNPGSEKKANVLTFPVSAFGSMSLSLVPSALAPIPVKIGQRYRTWLNDGAYKIELLNGGAGGCWLAAAAVVAISLYHTIPSQLLSSGAQQPTLPAYYEISWVTFSKRRRFKPIPPVA